MFFKEGILNYSLIREIRLCIKIFRLPNLVLSSFFYPYLLNFFIVDSLFHCHKLLTVFLREHVYLLFSCSLINISLGYSSFTVHQPYERIKAAYKINLLLTLLCLICVADSKSVMIFLYSNCFPKLLKRLLCEVIVTNALLIR